MNDMSISDRIWRELTRDGMPMCSCCESDCSFLDIVNRIGAILGEPPLTIAQLEAMRIRSDG